MEPPLEAEADSLSPAGLVRRWDMGQRRDAASLAMQPGVGSRIQSLSASKD